MTAPRRIYDLLPELYRRLDAGNNYALRELAEVLGVGRSQIERDIHGLYRDWFVETASRAALDRIGALVGTSDIPADAADRRALIADAVAFRRREGTRAAAEIRLRDLSGWPVAIGAANDDGSVTVDVWQDQACRSAFVAPVPLDAGRARPHAFRLHPLGIDVPLYQVPDRRRHMDRVFSPEYDASLPLRFEASPDVIARAVELQFADTHGTWHAIAPERIALTALGEWRASSRHSADAAVAIDPRLGRLIVLDPALIGAPLLASFGWVPPGTIGGGSYDRPLAARTASWIAEVDHFAVACPTAQPPVFSSLGDALTAFRGAPGCGLIRIHDSTTHDIGDTTIHDHADICLHDPDAPRRLTIEAAGGESPTLRGRLQLRGAAVGLDLTLEGLWIDGTVGIEGTVALTMMHCTLRPGSATNRAGRDVPAIKVGKAESGQHVTIAHSLIGPLDLARDVALDLESCVVDGYDQRPAIAGRPVLTARRTTVIGDADVAHLAADDTFFAGTVAIAHRGRGHIANCVTIDGPGVQWRSPVLGQPGYARLGSQADDAVFKSAGDGGEIGAFGGDRDGQRAALLRSAIPDILPAGQRNVLAWR